MITPREILLVPILLIFLLIGSINGLFRQMDKNLNYSMKKKIKWGPFKNLYASNRQEESLHGPVLEDPNNGVYSPVAILIAILFFATLSSLVWAIILIGTEYTTLDYKIMLFTSLGVAVCTLIVATVFYYIHVNKYVKHQNEYIHKIANILRERNK